MRGRNRVQMLVLIRGRYCVSGLCHQAPMLRVYRSLATGLSNVNLSLGAMLVLSSHVSHKSRTVASQHGGVSAARHREAGSKNLSF